MSGVDSEFSAIFDAYYARIRKLCLGYTNSPEEAEDLVQDTFLSAWQHWNAFRGQSARPTWLYRIAVNKCLSHLKKKDRSNSAHMNFHQEQIDQVDVKGDITILYMAINRLEKLDRLLISLYLDEFSYREIAEVLGLRENTIAVKIHRLKKQLTEIFNSYERV
jgi:RNA polymerase sigma-70 factor (ECF subfamily)